MSPRKRAPYASYTSYIPGGAPQLRHVPPGKESLRSYIRGTLASHFFAPGLNSARITKFVCPAMDFSTFEIIFRLLLYSISRRVSRLECSSRAQYNRFTWREERSIGAEVGARKSRCYFCELNFRCTGEFALNVGSYGGAAHPPCFVRSWHKIKRL